MATRNLFQRAYLTRAARACVFVVLALSGSATAFAQVVPPDETARVEVSPVAGSPGTRVNVMALDLQPARTYDVLLVNRSGTTSDLGDATSDSRGDFRFSAIVPLLPAAGDYEVRVSELVGFPPRPIRARTGFTVLAPLDVIALSGVTPRPGSRVSARVSGLIPGTVELKYAGVTIAGPVTVSSPNQSLGFIIPEDRPASLPASVALLAINRVGRDTVNTGTRNINVSPRSATPIQIGSTIAPPPLRPAARLALGGRLSREDGIEVSAGTTVDAYWFGADGSVVPLPGNAMAFDAQGDFNLTSASPGLASMTSGLANGLGQIAYIAREQSGYAFDEGIDYTFSTGNPFSNQVFRSTPLPQQLQLRLKDEAAAPIQIQEDGTISIRVRGPGGVPVPNAVVEISPASSNPFTDSFLDNTNAATGPNGSSGAFAVDNVGRKARTAVMLGASQFTDVAIGMVETIGVGAAPYVTPDCPATLKRQVTDADGRVEFQLDLDVLTDLLTQFEDCEVVNRTPICKNATSIALTLTVYGGQSGFGFRNPTTEAYEPATYNLVYLADRQYANDNYDGAYFMFQPTVFYFGGSAGNLNTLNPRLTLDLPLMNVPAVVVENVHMDGLPRESQPPTDGDVPIGSNGAAWFAPKLTIPLNTGSFASPNPVYSMFFSHSPLVGGTLTSASFWFDTDSNGALDRVGDFVFSTNQAGQCGLTSLDTYELPFGANSSALGLIFRYGVPGVAGERTQRCGEIRATNQAGGNSKRQVCFQFAPLLNLDLYNGNTDNLVFNDDSPGYLSYGADFRASRFPSGARNYNVPSVDNDDGTGGLVVPDQRNEVNNRLAIGGYFQSVGGSYTDTYQFNEAEQANYRGLLTSANATRTTANVQASNEGAAQSATQGLGASATTTGSLDPVTVLDVSFPLFYYVWGVAPIAGLEMGADLSLLAQMTALTTIKTNKVENLTSIGVEEVLTRQLVDIGIDFYADVDVLFDLVDAEINLRPILCAGVQVQYPGTPRVKELARVKLVFDYLFSVWVAPPFVNVEFKDSTTLADEGDPECQTIDGVASPAPSGQFVDPRPDRYSVAMGTDLIQTDTEQLTQVGFTAYTDKIANPSPADEGKTRLLVKRPAQAATEIVRAYGVRSVDIAYYAQNRAVVVWVQSALPPPTSGADTLLAVTQLVAQQHVRYALWNGTSWSAPANLTAPGSGGEGGLSLAACHDNTANCGAGKLLAVWTRSTSGDFRDMRTRVYRSEFTPGSGGGWSTPSTLDATGVNDSHATAAYRNGLPVVAWLRNGAGTMASAKNRGLAYRVLDGTSPVRIASGVPAGVSWPKLAVDDANRLGIAFTVSEDSRAFLGNRNAVHVGELGCNSSGTCTFNVVKVRDRRGRSLYAEKPKPVWNFNGDLFVGYRGVNYGADSAGTRRNYAEDPVGIRFKSGEAMMFASNLTSPTVEPIAMSNDGGGYSDIDFAFSSESGSVLALGVRTNAFVSTAAARARSLDVELAPAGAAMTMLSESVVNLERPTGADLAVTDVSTARVAIAPASSRFVEVTVSNRGTAYVPIFNAPATLRAYWDNPAARSGPAVSVPIAALASGASRTVRISVPMPASFAADEQHLLFVRVVGASDDMEDVDAGNDQRSLAIGGMPVPQAVTSATQPNLPMVRLEWDAAGDTRVKGYRIYRQDGTGPIVPLGSSRLPAFVDISAQYGETRTYFVSTFSQRGVESPLSEGIPAMTEKELSEVLFGNGFEGQ